MIADDCWYEYLESWESIEISIFPYRTITPMLLGSNQSIDAFRKYWYKIVWLIWSIQFSLFHEIM